VEETWELAALMPSIMRTGKYRVFFFSQEGPRKHVHVETSDGIVKIWLDDLSVKDVENLSAKQVRDIVKFVRPHREEFERRWNAHFNVQN
jgi:hypothetical protein